MTQNMISFPIIELAYVHQVFYDGDADDRKNFHYKISYLVNVNESEPVCEFYPSSLGALKCFPLIVDSTPIAVFQQDGNIERCVATTTVGEASLLYYMGDS